MFGLKFVPTVACFELGRSEQRKYDLATIRLEFPHSALRDGFANCVLRLRWLAGFAKLALSAVNSTGTGDSPRIFSIRLKNA